jgi:NAD(P)-dependent dehydrogenase (short-subunit alcohol dehydrogenase family)
VSSLTDKVAVLTGGSSGIGRAAALALAREGAAVLIGDIDETGAAGAAEQIEADGGRALASRCDVNNPEQIERLIERASSELGGVDIVFGNAGVLATASLEELTVESFERHLSINLTANFVLAKAAAPALRRRGGGSLIFTASLGGLRGTAGSAAYNASKGGLVNLTRSLAAELGPDRIRVNCICPGWVDTPFNDPFWDHEPAGAKEQIVSRIPLRRQSLPEEIATTVVFLAGEASGYVTGHALVVDGGIFAT